MREINIIPIAMRKASKGGITTEWIQNTIRAPEQITEGYGGRKVAQRKMALGGKGYLFRVVYEETAEKITVVTAYLTSQISRCWKEGQ